MPAYGLFPDNLRMVLRALGSGAVRPRLVFETPAECNMGMSAYFGLREMLDVDANDAVGYAAKDCPKELIGPGDEAHGVFVSAKASRAMNYWGYRKQKDRDSAIQEGDTPCA